MPEPIGVVAALARFVPWLWNVTLGGVLFRRKFSPFVVADRCFVWEELGPVYRIADEREPVQLLAFHRVLSRAMWESPRLRELDVKPAFRLPDQLTGGKLVYETDAKFQWKRKLLGGSGDGPGSQILEVVARGGETGPSWCECGGFISQGGNWCPDCGKPAPRRG